MYRRLLVIVADHPGSQKAVAHGLCLARALQAELLFVHLQQAPALALPADIPPTVSTAPEALLQQSAQRGQELLADARRRAEAAGLACRGVSLHALDGIDAVATMAREQQCDLIVVGSEGGNALVRLLTGSAVPGLITRAAVPVMVCHAADPVPADDAAAGAAAASDG